MKLIVGLGNPGRKYEQTRHNVGFIVAAKVASLTSAASAKIKFQGEFAEGSGPDTKIGILCPHTYMNASGQSVRKAVDFYKLDHSDILVVCDDLNLDGGRIRIRPSGSAGGQKGVKDIIRHLGTEDIPRLRVGIGRPPEGWTVTDYVLGKFSKPEQELFEAATTKAAHAVLCWASEGVGAAMNQFNTNPKPKQKRKPEPTPKVIRPEESDQESSETSGPDHSPSP